LLGSINIMVLLIRRLFFVTAYLQFAYYDFFKTMPKDYFRQGIMRRFGLESPYNQSIETMIGDLYYLPGSYANNGLFSDAYANLGVAGIIILPIMIALVLKLLDRACEGVEIGKCIGIIFVASYTLLSSSFFTVMITHGFLVGCLVMYLMPRMKAKEYESICTNNQGGFDKCG